MNEIENELGNMETAVQKLQRLIEEHKTKFIMLPSQARCQVFDKRKAVYQKDGELVSCFDAETNTLSQLPSNWDWFVHKALKRPDFRAGNLGLILLNEYKQMICVRKADFFVRRAEWFKQLVKLHRLLEIHRNYDSDKSEEIPCDGDTEAALLRFQKKLKSNSKE